MKRKTALPAACFFVILLIGVFHVQAQSPLEQASFCTAGETRPCPDVGICKDQVKACEGGRWSQACTGGTGPVREICDNGLDDNCDGEVDECVNITDSIGIFLIIGGVILLIFAFVLSRVFK
jgi:hypothetical protein